MERVIAYRPDESELLTGKEPKFRAHLDKPFTPFTIEDFADRILTMPDFYASLSFNLDGLGKGEVRYVRDLGLGFNAQWAKENAATPLGAATLSYSFRLGPDPEGMIVPPIELLLILHWPIDRFPPDQLLSFPKYGKGILGRWEKRIYDPELHPLPLVIPRYFILPEYREIRTVYLPEDPRILSDLTVTFLSTDSEMAGRGKK